MHLDTNVLTRSPVGIVDEPNNRGQSLKEPRLRGVVEKEIVIIEPWTIVRIIAYQFFQLLHVKRAKEKQDVMITSPISIYTSCMSYMLLKPYQANLDPAIYSQSRKHFPPLARHLLGFGLRYDSRAWFRNSNLFTT